MLRAMTTPLAYSLEGTTAVLRMDDGKANALSETMIDALLDGIARAEREASAAVMQFFIDPSSREVSCDRCA